MKNKIYKAIKTVYFSSSVKVFYEEARTTAGNVKRISKDKVRESIYNGFYDLTNSIKEGDYFTIEG